MKINELEASLKEMPWLLRSIYHLTGVTTEAGEMPQTMCHASDLPKGDWYAPTTTWALQNIRSINVLPFPKLDLKTGPLEERHFLAERQIYLHPEKFISLEPLAFARRIQHLWSHLGDKERHSSLGIEYAPSSWNLHRIMQEAVPELVPDSVVWVIQVGVLGECCSTRLQIHHFPPDFDRSTVA